MNLQQTKEYLDSLSLANALWWFIENINDESQWHTTLFFHLRGRVRDEAQKDTP